MPTKLSFQDRRVIEDALADTPPFATARGRQAIVRDALGGYPLSGEIDKALQYVDWEGGSILVAKDLIRLLEGQEVAPGVPALALLTQAIEPMAGTAHREKLADLRRRMGWREPDRSLEVEPAVAPAPQLGAAGGTIFISYAHADLDAARQLYEDLKNLGGPDAVAWFDKSALKPGDEWGANIISAVQRCSLFLPLISRQTELRAEGYFRLEWHEAAERSKRIQGRKFIFPIVIDPDYDGGMSRYKLVPKEFKAFQYSHAPAGKLSDALKAEMAEQLRSLRPAESAGSTGSAG